MKMPLTLAITECLLVVAGSDTFAIPIDAVVETVVRAGLEQPVEPAAVEPSPKPKN
jgi:chemotaxis protein histidine kinase CheA